MNIHAQDYKTKADAVRMRKHRIFVLSINFNFYQLNAMFYRVLHRCV